MSLKRDIRIAQEQKEVYTGSETIHHESDTEQVATELG